MNDMSIKKDETDEHPIPVVWRAALKQVADLLVRGDQPATVAPLIVATLDSDTNEISHQNIAVYPDALGPLADKAWDTSVYIWMGDHWDILIDLTAANGETSDLVLHAKIRESGEQFTIEPGPIYVP